jgi:hypothetical protein
MKPELRVLELITHILLLVTPVLSIQRKNILGIVIETLIYLVIFITSDLLRFGLRGQQINNEDWELWNIIWIPMLLYGSFIFGLQWFWKEIVNR